MCIQLKHCDSSSLLVTLERNHIYKKYLFTDGAYQLIIGILYIHLCIFNMCECWFFDSGIVMGNILCEVQKKLYFGGGAPQCDLLTPLTF